MIPQVLTEGGKVHLPPLAIAANASRPRKSADAFGVGHNPWREIPSFGPQQGNYLARRQPIDNTAIGGCAD